MLVIVAMFWGSSCLLTKIALDDLQELNLTALRFVIGFILSFAIFFKKLKIDKKMILHSAALATNYFIVLIFMTYGIQYTTVSNAGFLTCLSGVFVPIFGFIAFKQKLDKKTILCVVATGIGVYLLTMSGGDSRLSFNLGDILCILCSAFFSIQIMMTGAFVKRVDALTLSILQIGFTGFYSLIFTFIFEAPHFPTTQASWLSVLGLIVLCTISASIMQAIAQKHTTTTHTGLILSLEPVFAVLSAYIFLKEVLSAGGYTGAAIMLASIVLLEIDMREIIKK